MRFLYSRGRGRLAIGKSLIKLALAAGNARLDGTDGYAENPGNFLVRVILQIKQRQRRTIKFGNLRERGNHGCGIKLVNHRRWNGGQFASDFVKFIMRETGVFAARLEELAVQGGEEPRFHF